MKKEIIDTYNEFIEKINQENVIIKAPFLDISDDELICIWDHGRSCLSKITFELSNDKPLIKYTLTEPDMYYSKIVSNVDDLIDSFMKNYLKIS